VLAVTVLTSTGATAARGTRRRVLDLARGALHAGCDGVVASAREAPALRRAFGQELRILCPGIRPRHAQAGDQERIATPAEAVARGADWLVVGRPITAAANPRQAAQRILQEMEEGAHVNT
jgi:orotidine-5'-phosphate decarboxylase